MVRVYFGKRENAIYNTSVFFKNKMKDSWITDPFAKEVIRDVDHSEVLNSNEIESPVLGRISPYQLSGGVKALILMRNYQKYIFNASNCGDNCAKWILYLGKEKDFTINLHHIMDFGPDPFEIQIMNSKNKKLITHNMQEFLDAGVKYLQEEKR